MRRRCAAACEGEALGKGNAVAGFETLISSSDYRREDAASDVVLAASATGSSRKDQSVGREGVSPLPMRPQKGAKNWLQADLTQSRLRLRDADLNAPGGKIDVSPAERRDLMRTQASEDQCRDQRKAVTDL